MFRLFSVDDHIVEPPGVWVDRVPQALKERVPHVVARDGGQVHKTAEALFDFPLTVPDEALVP